MAICLVVQPIHAAGYQRLAAAGVEVRHGSGPEPDVISRDSADVDAVITRNWGFPPLAVQTAQRLRAIANHGIGMNKIDVAGATARGIPVVFTPYANARSVAEHAISLTLSLTRRAAFADQEARRGNFDLKYDSGMVELFGKTFGLVGFGAIGRITAGIAKHGFGMRTLVFSPSAPDADIEAARAERSQSLVELLTESDVVSLHRPLRPDTEQMVNAETLGRMKRSAYLINTARGGLIDEAALASALHRRVIAGAGLDVFATEPMACNNPLLSAPNLVMSPHIAGATEEAAERCAVQAAEQILDVLAGRRPAHLANPEVWSS
jgi:D-3-phosphoglycerate dehydrogenase